MSAGEIRLSARLNLGRLPAKLRQFPQQLKKEADALLKESARLLISSGGKVPGLVQVTPPFGDGKKGTAAKKQGEGAVTRDVWRVYGTPGKTYAVMRGLQPGLAAGFWKAVQAKDWDKANALVRSAGMGSQYELQAFDDGAAHERRRDRRGRVTRQKITVTVFDGRTVERYIKAKKKWVGLLASAVPTAAGSRFGTLTGVPAWVKRHSSRYGIARVTKGGSRVVLGVSARGNADLKRRFSYAALYRRNAMKRQLPFRVRAAVKKAGLGG